MNNIVYVLCKLDGSNGIIKVLRVFAEMDECNKFIRKRKFENDGIIENLKAFPVPAGLDDMLSEETHYAF